MHKLHVLMKEIERKKSSKPDVILVVTDNDVAGTGRMALRHRAIMLVDNAPYLLLL